MNRGYLVIARRGKSLMIVSDNGAELTSRAMLEWVDQIKLDWHYITPGKPTENGYRPLKNLPIVRSTKNRQKTTQHQPKQILNFSLLSAMAGHIVRDCITKSGK